MYSQKKVLASCVGRMHGDVPVAISSRLTWYFESRKCWIPPSPFGFKEWRLYTFVMPFSPDTFPSRNDKSTRRHLFVETPTRLSVMKCRTVEPAPTSGMTAAPNLMSRVLPESKPTKSTHGVLHTENNKPIKSTVSSSTVPREDEDLPESQEHATPGPRGADELRKWV